MEAKAPFLLPSLVSTTRCLGIRKGIGEERQVVQGGWGRGGAYTGKKVGERQGVEYGKSKRRDARETREGGGEGGDENKRGR